MLFRVNAFKVEIKVKWGPKDGALRTSVLIRRGRESEISLPMLMPRRKVIEDTVSQEE